MPTVRGEVAHASAVALEGRAVVILGPSGAGKSSLALRLMALGCSLVSDDRTALRRVDGTIFASAPAGLAGLIEARGVGLLMAEALAAAPVVLAVDLGRRETERLPPWRSLRLLGEDVPCLHSVESEHFPAAIMQYLRAGRSA